jgi:benzoyl-CoA reductase subunit A
LIRIPLGEIGIRSFQIDKQPDPVESTCVLFAKSEIIGLLDRGMPVNEVIAAYCMSMAHRVATLVKRLGVETEICITGGISKNDGVVKRIEQELGVQALEKKWHNPVYRDKNYPFDTQICGCSGAALIAYDLLKQGEVQSRN